jgi:hypothetical protein
VEGFRAAVGAGSSVGEHWLCEHVASIGSKGTIVRCGQIVFSEIEAFSGVLVQNGNKDAAG